MQRVSETLSASLKRQRERLNAHVRRQGRGLDGEALLGYLAHSVDPVTQAVPAEHVDAVVEAMVVVGVQAFRRGLLAGTAEGTPFEAGLRATLPLLGEHFGRAPRRVLAAVGNAYHRLAQAVGTPAATRWLGSFAEAAPACPTEADLLAAGLVLAWREGLAEARSEALGWLATAPPALRVALVGTERCDDVAERRFAPLGSSAPLVRLDVIARVGGFVGFGGDFAAPPEVRALDGRLFATDGEVVRELFADAYGARLCRTPRIALQVLEEGTEGGITVSERSVVRWGELSITRPELHRPSSAAVAAGMGALSLPTSHCVFVLGQLPAAAGGDKPRPYTGNDAGEGAA